MADDDLRPGAVLAVLHQRRDGLVGPGLPPGLARHMDGALGGGVGDDVDAQGVEQRPHQRAHPAVFNEVVEVLQGEAGPQRRLVQPQLGADVLKVPSGL